MTAQFKEKLYYKATEFRMSSEPFNKYLDLNKVLKFYSDNTGLMRGYFGVWEIKNNQLWLIRLTANLNKNTEVQLDYFFPGKNEVFAEWYSGILKVPHGKMLQYIHAGYGSKFEKTLFIEINAGMYVREWEE